MSLYGHTFEVTITATYEVVGASSPERAEGIALALLKGDLKSNWVGHLEFKVEDLGEQTDVNGEPF